MKFLPYPYLPSQIIFSSPQKLTFRDTEGALKDLYGKGHWETRHHQYPHDPPEMVETPLVNGPAQQY